MKNLFPKQKILKHKIKQSIKWYFYNLKKSKQKTFSKVNHPLNLIFSQENVLSFKANLFCWGVLGSIQGRLYRQKDFQEDFN